MASPIAASPEFTALQAHAAEVKQGTSVPKLRELLQDDARLAAFKAEADGIYLDYTRQVCLWAAVCACTFAPAMPLQ